MCGFVGLINRTKKHSPMTYADEALRYANYYNRLRGTDALGLFKVEQDFKHSLIKEVGDPYKLWQEKKFADYHHWADRNKFFLVHNRKATVGEKTQACAHPFLKAKEDKENIIILAHNGTLTHINQEYEKRFPGKTDSEQIAKMMAANISLAEFDAAVWGGYALVWYDSEDRSLNFFRNDQRPFGYIEVTEGIWFGSEVYAVAAALDRSKAPIKLLKYTEPMVHYKYHSEDDMMEETKISPLKSQSSSTAYDQSSLWRNGWGDGYADDSFILPAEKEEVVETPLPKKESCAVIPFNGTDPSTNVDIGAFSRNRRERFQRSAANRKKKYGQVSEALGWTVGSTAFFCLTNYTRVGSAQSSQIQIEGQIVVWDEGLKQWALMPRCDSIGMITSPQMEEIDRSNCLWSGIISSMGMCKATASDIAEYRFHMKDIKPETDEKDMFMMIPRNVPKLPTPAAAAEVAEGDPTVGSTECEGTLTDSAGNVLCDDCRYHYPKSVMFHLIHTKDGAPLRLNFCKACWTANLVDSKLDTIHSRVMRQVGGVVEKLLKPDIEQYKPEERILH